jgi:C-terminal processing protease CtpA/Prc
MRTRKLIIVGAYVLVATGAVFLVRRVSSSARIEQTYLAVSNVVDDVTSRVRGQIGVSLATDTATGLPVIESTLIGSPAELAGLKPGDVISHVDNKSLAGVPLPQVATLIRGLSRGSVELRVQRPRSTNELILTIHRASVKAINSL